MSPELIGVITVGVALASLGVALAGLILNGQRTIGERLTRLESNVAHLRERMAHLEGLFAMFTSQHSSASPAITPAAIESP